MANNSSADDTSLSGSPLVGVARDWAQGRTAKDQCAELFVRVLQLSIVCQQLCYMLGTTMDDVLHTGAERSLQEMGVSAADAERRSALVKGGDDAGTPSSIAESDLPG